MAATGEDFDRSLKEGILAPSESARTGVIDQDGVLVSCDWLFSRFLVKL
jgi:hypothetical protein